MRKKDSVLNVKRLEINQIEKKLNVLMGLGKNEDTPTGAFLTMLVLSAKSPKHKMPAGVPFPAIVKRAEDGSLAVFNCTNAKQEIIPEHGYREPVPIGEYFEYKGHAYKRSVLPLYVLKK